MLPVRLGRMIASMFNTVIWATDGSEHADRALPYAKALTKLASGRLLVVHGVEHLSGPGGGNVTLAANEEEIKARIEQQVTELTDDGLDATLKIVGGPSLAGAAHMIADVAREVGADTIVVGARGRTQLAGLLVGNVTHRLLHISPCPVLAVPAA